MHPVQGMWAVRQEEGSKKSEVTGHFLSGLDVWCLPGRSRRCGFSSRVRLALHFSSGVMARFLLFGCWDPTLLAPAEVISWAAAPYPRFLSRRRNE